MRMLLRTTVLLLLAPIAVAAQSARLSGVLVDATNSVLPGAIVRATSTSNGQETTVTVRTDRDGRYTFTGLPSGTYTLTTVLPGFESARETVSLNGSDVEKSFTLNVGSIEETVTAVAGETPAPSVRERPAVVPPAPRPQAGADRIGGSIKPPTKVYHVSPIYPAAMAASGTAGDVVLTGVIGVDGLMHDVKTTSAANPDFERAAIDAFSQWEFTPTLLNGTPIETRIRGTFHFAAK